MNELYQASMEAAVQRLYDEQDDVTGVVLASAKKTFFAGGNLKSMVTATPDDADEIFAMGEAVKASLRRLETFPRPVVAAINGAALGGGLEIALAANRRIAVDDRSVKIGLPESTLGLLPGGGGVTRVVRMLGLQSALMDVLMPGTQFDPQGALAKGLIDEVRADPRGARPGREGVDPRRTRTTRTRRRTRGTAPATRCPAAPRRPRRWRSSCPPSRRCCASRPRARSTPRRARS